jgi:hypothetical protein
MPAPDVDDDGSWGNGGQSLSERSAPVFRAEPAALERDDHQPLKGGIVERPHAAVDERHRVLTDPSCELMIFSGAK